MSKKEISTSLPVIAGDPLVSVLLTNYNCRKYVADAIKSVLGQNYSPFEIVLCDDGSTDGSREILREFAVSFKNVVLVEKENGGHASALNRAFGLSRGSIICFLDADDLFGKEKLFRVVQTFAANHNVGLLVNDLELIDEEGAHLGFSKFGMSGNLGPEITSLHKQLPLPQSSGLSFRREVLSRILPIPEKPFRTGADWAIGYTAAFITQTGALKEALSSYRIHRNNISGTTKMLPRLEAAAIKRTLASIENVLAFVRHFMLENYNIEVPTRLTRNYVEHAIIYAILTRDKPGLRVAVDDLRNAFRYARRDYSSTRYIYWRAISSLPPIISRSILQGTFRIFRKLNARGGLSWI